MNLSQTVLASGNVIFPGTFTYGTRYLRRQNQSVSTIVWSSQKKKYVYIYIYQEKKRARVAVGMLLLFTFFKSAMAVYRKENTSIKLILNSEETIFGTPTNNDTKLK